MLTYFLFIQKALLPGTSLNVVAVAADETTLFRHTAREAVTGRPKCHGSECSVGRSMAWHVVQGKLGTVPGGALSRDVGMVTVN